mmetsp:Transcript_32563/g.36925  ORF Transcript_32563/g.36925 Transcript_32563/m.36925 type:complete len:91 (-) Transcript_32563:40-312(-)
MTQPLFWLTKEPPQKLTLKLTANGYDFGGSSASTFKFQRSLLCTILCFLATCKSPKPSRRGEGLLMKKFTKLNPKVMLFVCDSVKMMSQS